MNDAHVPSKILICGPSGSGKTSLAFRFLCGWRAAWRFVFDHDDQWTRKLQRPAASTWQDCKRQLAAGRLCIFNPRPRFGRDRRGAFCWFVRNVFDASERINQVKLLVAEEIGMCTPESRNELDPEIDDLMTLGRRRELDLIACSQLPNEIHHKIRNQFTHMAAFRFSDPNPLRWLEGFGYDPEQIKTLPKFSYLWKPNGEPARLISP